MRALILTLTALLLFPIHFIHSQESPSQTTRFAWFTDTHVGGSTGAKDLRIVTDDVRKRAEVDFVIVSGDITEMDTEDHLSVAKAILDSMEVPYHIIPGNHDTKWSSSGAGKFTQLWGDDRFNFEFRDIRFVGIHQGPVMRMADGYIDPDDIAWVDSVLRAMPNPRQKVFIVQHYPLDQSVDNWYAMRDVIRPYNIQAILHGHGHRNKVLDYEGVPGVMSRSTLRRGQQPTGYTLVELTDERAMFTERIPLADSSSQWHELELGDRHFADSLLLPYPDFSWNDSSNVELIWQVETGAIITSSASIDGDQVFVANTSGKVVSLDLLSGSVNWSQPIAGSIHSTPAVKGKHLVFGSTDSTIRSLNTLDGHVNWVIKTSGPVLGSPTIHKRNVFIGSGDGVFRSLKLRNGRSNWEYSKIGGYIETKPLIVDKKVLFSAWDGGFYALNSRSGNLLWRWSDGPSGLLYSPAACWPVVSNQTVFIVAPDRVMTAIDLKSGKTSWRKVGHKVRETIGISEDGRQVFARTMNDSCLAIDAQASEFSLNWIKHLGFGYDISPNAMVEKDGHVFLSTKDGWIYCLESLTGQTIWKYRISDGLVNTLTVVSGREVICTAADGKVSLLQYGG